MHAAWLPAARPRLCQMSETPRSRANMCDLCQCALHGATERCRYMGLASKSLGCNHTCKSQEGQRKPLPLKIHPITAIHADDTDRVQLLARGVLDPLQLLHEVPKLHGGLLACHLGSHPQANDILQQRRPRLASANVFGDLRCEMVLRVALHTSLSPTLGAMCRVRLAQPPAHGQVGPNGRRRTHRRVPRAQAATFGDVGMLKKLCLAFVSVWLPNNFIAEGLCSVV